MSRVRVAALAAIAGAYALAGGCDAPSTDSAADRAALERLGARLTALEADVARAADYEAIWAQELRYTRGLDRHDEALINAVFWPDAAISYGTLVPYAEVAPWANESHSSSAAHQHHVTGLTLDFAGDAAHEEGYILYSSDMARDPSLDTEGAPTPGRPIAGSTATLGTGRYVNRYERRGGEWRMLVHEYVHDIGMRMEAVDVCATACLGTWDRSDISYLRPLQPLTTQEREQRAEQGRAPRGLAAPE